MNAKRIVILTILMALTSMSLNVMAQNPVDPHFEKIDFAHGLFQRNLYDMAANEYKQYIEQFPDSGYAHDAYFGLAESYFFSKDYEKAQDVYQEYIDLFDNRDKINFVRLRLGQCLLNQKKYDEAYMSIQKITDDNLDDEWQQKKYLFLGEINAANGDIEQSIKNYKKIEKIVKDNDIAIETYIKLGELYQNQKEYDKAIANFRSVVKYSQKPELTSIALYKQAETEFMSERYEESADIFSQVIELKVDSTLVEDAVSNLLLALFNVPAYNAVISRYEYYKELLTANGRLFDAQYVLARSYKQLGEYDKSLSEINKALQIKKITEEQRNKALELKVEGLFLGKHYYHVIKVIDRFWKGQKKYLEKGLFFKAESYYSLAQFQNAHDLYDKLLKEFPKTEYKSEAYYGLAHAKNALGQEDEAVALFEEFFSSTDDEEKKKEALFNQILLKSKQEDPKPAIKDALRYLKKYPSDKNEQKISFLLGSLYSREGSHTEAIGIFKKIVEGDTTNPKLQESRFLLAYSYQLSGQNDMAIENYEKVALDRENPTLFYSARKNMALLFLEKKDHARAVVLLKDIINSNADNDLTVDMYLWLAEKSMEAKAYSTVLKVLEKSEEKAKTDDDRQAIAFFKASAYQKQGDCQNAMSWFNKVITIDNESLFMAQGLIGKVQCLVVKSDYANAKNILDDILLKFSDDDTVSLKARFEMGNLLERQNKLEEAAKFYMLVAVLYNDSYFSPESLFRAGSIFERINKINEARNVYQEIIQLYTTSHRFNEAQKRLAELNK